MHRRRIVRSKRRGVGTLDYVLVLGVAFPCAGVCLYLGSQIIRLVYEMQYVLIEWPFL